MTPRATTRPSRRLTLLAVVLTAAALLLSRTQPGARSALAQATGPDFTLSCPAAFSIPQGASGSVTCTATSVGGFFGTLSVTCTVFPPCTFPATASVPLGGSASIPVTVTAGAQLSLDTYTVAVRATSGSLVHAANMSLTVTAPDPTCDNSWQDPTVSGDWSDSTKWSTNAAPGAGQKVCLPSGNYLVSALADRRAGSLTIGAGVQFLVAGDSHIGHGFLTIDNDFVNNGTVSLGPAVDDGLGATVAVTNGTLINNGTIIASTSQAIRLIRASIDNTGLIRLRANLSLDKAGAVITNRGQIDMFSNVTLSTASSATGLSLVQTGGGTITGGGRLSLGATNGTFSAVGVINANVALGNGASNPGGAGAAGGFAVNGDYQQSFGVPLNIEIGGLTSGGYDQLNVTGALNIGNINISMLNGFVPAAGDCFRIATYGSRTPTFLSFGGLTQGSVTFTPVVGNTDITLVANGATCSPVDYTVTCAPGLLSGAQGGISSSGTCTAGALHGFANDVILGCSGLPAGATCTSFNPNPVSLSSGAPTATSTFSVRIPGNLAPGTYPFNAMGRLSGGDPAFTHLFPMQLQVTQGPDFSLSCTPATVSGIAGTTTGASTCTATSLNGFAADLTLTCANLPSMPIIFGPVPQPQCQFTPPQLTVPAGGTATTSLTVILSNAFGPFTQAGTFPFQVTASTGSVLATPITHAFDMQLTVIPAPDFTVSCRPINLPIADAVGSQASSVCSVEALNAFSGDVTLSCVSADIAATCAFQPPTVSLAGISGREVPVTVSLGATAAVGTYVVEVDGSSGSLTRSGVLILDVNTVNRLYVAESGLNQVAVIDPENNRIVKTIPVGTTPTALVADPAGARVFVANCSCPAVGPAGPASITYIDSLTNQVLGTRHVSSPAKGLAVDPFGGRLYASLPDEDKVAFYRTDTANSEPEVLASLPPGSGAWGVAVHPSSTKVYIALHNLDELAVYTYSTVNNPPTVTTIPVGHGPTAVTVDPRGKYVYVANAGDGTISVVDTATNTVSDTRSLPALVTGPSAPQGQIAINPAGTRLYVPVTGNGAVGILNADLLTVSYSPVLAPGPFGVAVALDGSREYVTTTSNDKLYTLDAAGTPVGTPVALGAGAAPQGVALGSSTLAGDDSGGPTDYSVNCNAVNVVAGNTGFSTCTLNPGSSFTSTVTLTCTTVPANLSCGSFTPTVSPGLGNTTTIPVTATATPNGTIALRALSTNGITHNASIAVTVSAAPSGAADFSVSCDPPSLSSLDNATAGSSVSKSNGSTCTVKAINGLTSGVTLNCIAAAAGAVLAPGTAGGLPAGATCQWSTNSAAPLYTTTLTLNVSGVAAGHYAFQVDGVSGSIHHAVPLQLTVIPCTPASSTTLVVDDTDGLPDDWERCGVTVAAPPGGSGPQTINLPAFGANPDAGRTDRRDIYVQLDWMEGKDATGAFHSQKLSSEAIRQVVEAYRRHGYRLYVDEGPDSIMDFGTGLTWGNLSRAGARPWKSSLGVYTNVNGNQVYDWTDFDTNYKSLYFLPTGRRQMFHYALAAYTYAGTTSSGIARGDPASDFIVALGGDGIYGTDGNGQRVGTVIQQAGTFMHELGHNLGLDHGGVFTATDPVSVANGPLNSKPNYLSVMNYLFQLTGLVRGGGEGTIDYSDTALDPLDETHMDKGKGLTVTVSGVTTRFTGYSTRHYCPGVGPVTDHDASGALLDAGSPGDWDCKGSQTSGVVPFDVTGDGLCVKAGGGTLVTPVDPNDDQVGLTIRDSTRNFTCDSHAASPDIQNRPQFTAQTTTLLGSNDWLNLRLRRGMIGRGDDPEVPRYTVDTEPTAAQFAQIQPLDARDTRVPATTSTVTPAPNTAGWNRADVTVNLAATDNPGGAGVKEIWYYATGAQTLPYTSVSGGSASFTVSTEGQTTVRYWAVDNAGNIETAHPLVINIDRTASALTGAATTRPNDSGWYRTDVTVHWTCRADLSGLDGDCPADATVTGEGANLSATATVKDKAGNSTSTTVEGLKIDRTPPRITFVSRTPANANGWNKNDVTLTWSCDDTLSGAATATVTKTVSDAGANQAATGTCTDRAGNTASDTQTGINIDRTAPSVSLSTNATSYTIDRTVLITCTATDSLSTMQTSALSGPGIAGGAACAAQSLPGYSFTPGSTTTLTATATDKAGNTITKMVIFTVQAVDAAGLDRLIDQFVGNPGIANSLKQKADTIGSAPNANAKAGALGAFENEVHAQSGKALTTAQADLLIRLARLL